MWVAIVLPQTVVASASLQSKCPCHLVGCSRLEQRRSMRPSSGQCVSTRRPRCRRRWQRVVVAASLQLQRLSISLPPVCDRAASDLFTWPFPHCGRACARQALIPILAASSVFAHTTYPFRHRLIVAPDDTM